MTSREERDRRRAERVAAEKREAAAERRRLILGYVVAGVLALAVVVGIVIVIGASGSDSNQIGGEEIPEAAHIEVQTGFVNDARPDGREGTAPPPLAQGDLARAAEEAGCELRLDLPDEGSDHLRDSDDSPEWDTNPPTSGDHSPQQQADGAWTDVDELHTLHALEHGRISIQYSPDLSERDQLELKGVFDEDPAGMLFFPDRDMPYEVAATGWTQLLGCKRYEGQATLDAIRDFRDTYRGRGPEPFAITMSG
jgi:hypothetical protein